MLLCLSTISCNYGDSNTVVFDGGAEPNITTLQKIENETKNTFYPSFLVRVFNPLYTVYEPNNLISNKLYCWKLSQKTYCDFLIGNKKINYLPSYICGNCDISEEYYNKYYIDVINNENIKKLYPSCNLFKYELKGFSYNITIEKNNDILISSTSNFSTISLDDSQVGVGGNIDSRLDDFVENTYIQFKNADFLNKWAKYQSAGKYHGLNYKICTTINKEYNMTTLLIKNIIQITETINDYSFIYYICDLVNVTLNGVQNDDIYVESMDIFLSPLKDKTIDIVESFIDYSLLYLNN